MGRDTENFCNCTYKTLRAGKKKSVIVVTQKLIEINDKRKTVIYKPLKKVPYGTEG